ncbi:MAG: divalent-cation tolerance protein CutA [Elusimicrobia bacterium]|nr:divalent-cation tolerance protein CutA [Elusimicrobiota bacterium]
MASSARVVLVTVPSGGKAESLAEGAVEANLAACVNLVPGVVSIYRWKGRVHRDAETLLVIKTTAAKLKALERWVKARHPYELPEFLALPVAGGSKEYLKWLGGLGK